ncbi:hypothetical protein C0J52_12242 [Blattella germanica]|nr:hypothetical protein C0J52_12242 [Blattella germanica]
MSIRLFLATVLLLAGSATSRQVFETLYEWNLLNYDLPQGSYVPESNLFTGLEIYWDRIFLALPNLRSGVPATLTWLPRPDRAGASYYQQSPALQPYPGLEWQGTEGNCSGLVSVYRIRVDRCDRLWVLDSGVITTLDNFTPACPPKIFVFDLKTDRLVRNIVLPKEVLRPNTLLTNLVIDYEVVGGIPDRGSLGGFYGFQIPRQTCDDAFLYMTDTANAGIVVYDVRKDSAWRVFHPYMIPHPEHCTHIRLLYFQPFAGLRLYAMPTSVLQTPPGIDTDLQVRLIFEKTSQSASLASDPNDGTLYFNPISELALASLQPGSRHAQILVQDPDRLQFSSDILVTPRDNFNIWFVSSKFQQFFRRTYDPHVVNFRIMRIANTHSPTIQTPVIQAPVLHASPSVATPLHSPYRNPLLYY